MTGYNLKGPAIRSSFRQIEFHKLEDLKVSRSPIPVGSAAWGMLIKAMQDLGMKRTEHRARRIRRPPSAPPILRSKDRRARGLLPSVGDHGIPRRAASKMYDGSEAAFPICMGRSFARITPRNIRKSSPLSSRRSYEAGKWIEENPCARPDDGEVDRRRKGGAVPVFSSGRPFHAEPTIKPKWVETLKFDHGVLAQEKLASTLDFDGWIQEDYIKRAYAEMGLNYDDEKAKVVDTLVTNAGKPNEVWHARDGILPYSTIKEFLKAVAEFQATGTKLNATYVYDHATGLKLFGKTAFFVRKPDGEFVSFLRKGEAEEFAAKAKGTIFSFSMRRSRARRRDGTATCRTRCGLSTGRAGAVDDFKKGAAGRGGYRPRRRRHAGCRGGVTRRPAAPGGCWRRNG